ncbi:response regulator transcription factor [Vibrio parahaemolyticus]|uniref:response regulator transcription factor n=1 Tax=Vibrio parahaemolyticus TaxID=670 RepID=UPI00041E0119|nr:response regulator transcription factor [Vibrio parahaemolyticus]EJE4554645.1 response regulator transcription factor [Vibrio parahaemolyticus]HCH0376497.1 response regulator transcription factor [Vibrio parahaemolyticus]HCH1504342.1 response regulator transcription factor [Vibrio parahaemolyticus]HCH4862058.1 response regulator transcription factor [Vibrio parahaemolyticus]HCH4865949.1 response regulator transcription factor [Vibrio parahaemolyticus]
MERHTTNVVANILLIEDDDDLAELVQMHLKFQGHQVSRESSVAAGRNAYQQQSFDLVILDRGLPDGDGLDICHHLRQQQDWTPVLVLTARDGEMDKVDGLEADVDDYITKPFRVLEFQARVRNVLRRVNQVAEKPTPEKAEDGALNFGDLKIIPQLHQVSLNDKDVALTATEFTLLQFLATRPGRVYSKDELLDHVWNTNHAGYHHTVCSTINRLRSKLSLSDSEHHFIQTVWGVGYKFQPRP